MSADINHQPLSFPEIALDADPTIEAQGADIINFPMPQPEIVTEPPRLTLSDVEERAYIIASQKLKSKKAQRVVFNNTIAARAMNSTPVQQHSHSQLKSHTEHLSD